MDQRDLADFIIATMNQFDPPTTPSQYSTIALARYFTDFGEDDLAKMKDQALKTSIADIKAYKEVFDQAKNKKVYGVLGSKELIEKSKRDFDQIKTMND